MNSQTYGVNGTAKGRGYSEVEPIWHTRGLGLDAEPVLRFSELDRRDIFRQIVECEDSANKQAETLSADPRKQVDLSDELTTSCKERLRKRRALSQKELSAIGAEGVAKSWPPLQPTRVNIGPIIEAGLKLCE